jgi:hypothetical protein
MILKRPSVLGHFFHLKIRDVEKGVEEEAGGVVIQWEKNRRKVHLLPIMATIDNVDRVAGIRPGTGNSPHMMTNTYILLHGIDLVEPETLAGFHRLGRDVPGAHKKLHPANKNSISMSMLSRSMGIWKLLTER